MTLDPMSPNGPDDVVVVTPAEGIDALLELAEMGPVTLQTRRSGWSCDLWIGQSNGFGEPTLRGYGYEHGPHGAAATALAMAKILRAE